MPPCLWYRHNRTATVPKGATEQSEAVAAGEKCV